MKFKLFILVLSAFSYDIILKLHQNEATKLFYFNESIGTQNIFINPSLDLTSNLTIFPCHLNSLMDKKFYNPSKSANSQSQQIPHCDFADTTTINKKDFCEKRMEMFDNTDLDFRVFLDEINFKDNDKEIMFYCYEESDEKISKSFLGSIGGSILGMGPRNSFFDVITEGLDSIDSFDIKLNDDDAFIGFKEQEMDYLLTIPYDKKSNQYSFKVPKIEVNTESKTILLNQSFFINTLTPYSGFSSNFYFRFINFIKSSLPSNAKTFTLNYTLCFKDLSVNSLPVISIYFSPSLLIYWKPSQYTFKTAENSHCIGIFPSIHNYLGLNFLSDRLLTINPVKSILTFEDLTEIDSSPDDSSASSSNETQSESKTSQVNTNPNGHKTSNFFIFMICILVILAQIALGYYFLSRSRNQRLQEPPVELSEIRVQT